MRAVAVLVAILTMGCNAAQRSEIVERGDSDDEVVSLPGGGALILRRLREAEADKVCYARARSFHGLVPIPCDLAAAVRP